MKSVGVVASLLIMASSAAVAQQPKLPCGWYGDEGYNACVLAHAGARPAERYRDGGEELIRLFVLQGGRIFPPIVIVELILPKSGPAVMTIRDPQDKADNSLYAFDRSKFSVLRSQLISMPDKGNYPATTNADGTETVCLDPASGSIETVFDGKMRQSEFDYCQSESEYIDDILRMAVSIAPVCTELTSQSGWYAERLLHCLPAKETHLHIHRAKN